MPTTTTPARPYRATAPADARLREIGQRIANELILTIEKAAAHEDKARDYPVSAGSLEAAIYARLAKLPARQKRGFTRRAMQRVEASAAERVRLYGDLGKVNLKLAKPVAEQVAAIKVPDRLKVSRAEVARMLRITVPASTSTKQFNSLDLRLHKVRCDDDTDQILEFKDEIELDGVLIEADGSTRAMTSLDLGKFKTGVEVNFNTPKTIASFDLRQGQPPLSFVATLVLTEKDLGDTSGLIKLLVDQIQDKVAGKVSDFIIDKLGGNGESGNGESGSGGESGGTSLQNQLIVMLVALAVDALFKAIVALFADDVFTPQVVNIAIPSRAAPFDGNQTDTADETITFTGFGAVYKLVCDWQAR